MITKTRWLKNLKATIALLLTCSIFNSVLSENRINNNTDLIRCLSRDSNFEEYVMSVMKIPEKLLLKINTMEPTEADRYLNNLKMSMFSYYSQNDLANKLGFESYDDFTMASIKLSMNLNRLIVKYPMLDTMNANDRQDIFEEAIKESALNQKIMEMMPYKINQSFSADCRADCNAVYAGASAAATGALASCLVGCSGTTILYPICAAGCAALMAGMIVAAGTALNYCLGRCP